MELGNGVLVEVLGEKANERSGAIDESVRPWRACEA